MILRIFICFMLSGLFCGAASYDELQEQLKSATEEPEVHRLKSQIAGAALQRLEQGTVSKTEEKKLRTQVQAYCADVQLGSMDVWYGDSVVSWSRLLLLDGQWKESRALLLEQAEVLQNIEKNLSANNIPVSSISPVAGCRYVLGETYRLEFETLQTLEPAVEALKHFYNVYIKYGDSSWGEKAQAKAEAMQEILEGGGKQVRIDLGPHKKTFVANKFKLGARMVAEERYEDAIEPIETAINFFPETRQSVQALRNLAMCKLHLRMDNEVVAIAEYCCERFASDTNSPLAVLGIGRQAIEIKQGELGEELFGLYVQKFPEHQHRVDILSWFAWRAYKAEEWEKAARFFQSLETELRRIGQHDEQLEKAVFIQAIHPVRPEKLDAFMAEFPESERVASALSKKAQAQLVTGKYSEAFQTLETLKEKFPNAPASKKALSGLIVASVEAGKFDIAEQVLNRMLEDKKAYGYDVYLSTGEGLLKAGKFELAETAFAAVPLNANKTYVEQALMGAASCQFGRNEFEGCFQALEKLLTKFPTTGRFYDARLMQARCLVEMGHMDEAVKAYAEVGSQDYSVTIEMAGVLTDPEERLAAYQRVALLADPQKPENQPLIAESIVASLPLGMELQKYNLVVSACDQFKQLFPDHEKLPTIGKFRREAERALAN